MTSRCRSRMLALQYDGCDDEGGRRPLPDALNLKRFRHNKMTLLMESDAPAVAAPTEPASPFAPTGLVLREGLTFAEWTSIGSTLGTMERGLQWWIGDWLNYGEHAYGEKYSQAVQETGRDPQTLADMAWVAGRVETSRRRENLTFSHHREVAKLGADEQDRMLDQAEAEGWSVRALRDAVKASKNEIALPRAKMESSPAPVAQPSPTLSLNGNGAHAPAPSDGDDPDSPTDAPELLHELEEADRTIRAQQSELESLRAADHGSEIARLHERLARLEAHQMREQTKLVEAQRLVKAHRKTLQQVSDLLGVKDFGEIVPTLQRLVR